MPAFVENGPDIPERLLQAHEEGKVVFFTGSGISVPAGLPNFKGLVDALFKELTVTPNATLKSAYDASRYDTVIGLLEEEYVGQRAKVRNCVARILDTPESSAKISDTHSALLTLAETRTGQTRLVTTNFDRLFENVIALSRRPVITYKAPLLPIPKKRWNGLVYLHGLITRDLSQSELDRLILSSGDFGLAYLTERWASRFVSELFRAYIVCFIGYSIDDPVLRYMMDALAADRLLGENPPEVFAFGCYESDQKQQAISEWSSKHVTPLLYLNSDNHKLLHETLTKWAEIYRKGIHGKKMIISNHAITPPIANANSDYAVSRVLWALTDADAAQHFADLEPVPPIEWLEPLSELKFDAKDLPRFNLEARESDKSVRFSLLQKPARHNNAPWMTIVDRGFLPCSLDGIQFHLMRWLVRHIGNPELLQWVVKQGGNLHPDFAFRIRHALNNLAKAQSQSKESAAQSTRTPYTSIEALWSLILSGKTVILPRRLEMRDWFERFKTFGLTGTMRMELREFLSPCVELREPFLRKRNDEEQDTNRIDSLVHWNVRLRCQDVRYHLQEIRKNEQWNTLQAGLVEDFTLLLVDTLDLMRLLQGAEDRSDLSHIHQPSISPHQQNKGYNDWTILIELARDAFLSLAATTPEKAGSIATRWWGISYPTFKRLALFAATRTNAIEAKVALGWLTSENNWWLWSGEVRPESIRLLVYLATKLTEPERISIEVEIMKGPSRSWYRDDIEEERWINMRDREIWLRLAKLDAANSSLSSSGQTKFAELSSQHPSWKLHEDDQDEFSVWFTSGPDLATIKKTPSDISELRTWLVANVTLKPWEEDDWNDRCRNDFLAASEALCLNANQGEWTPRFWQEALYAWADEKFQNDSWQKVADVLLKMPEDKVESIADALALWLRAQAKSFERNTETFFLLIQRIIKLNKPAEETVHDDAVSYAINNPIGRATEALVYWWYRQKPKPEDGLEPTFASILNEISDPEIVKLRPGRVILAHHLSSLHMVDPHWANTYAVPLFSWKVSQIDASYAWQGFLWSPRAYLPLIEVLKSDLLETASYYAKLSHYAEQYVDLMTFLGVNSGNMFQDDALKNAFAILPPKGLQIAVRSMTRMMEGVSENHQKYWTDQLRPFFRRVWPKTIATHSTELSEEFARLVISSAEGFPEVFRELSWWIKSIEHSGSIIHKLNEGTLCTQFPLECLHLLNAIIGDDQPWISDELNQCLGKIVEANPELQDDLKYTRLKDYRPE